MILNEYKEDWPGAAWTPLYSGQPSTTRWLEATEAAGAKHYTIYDNLGRRIREIRDYVSGGEPETGSKQGVTVQRNVTSSFSYDGLDRAVRAVAHEYRKDAEGRWELEEEVTAYEYGVRRSGGDPELEHSALDSNDLLYRVLEGKKVGGGDEYSRQIAYAYDRQGALKWKGAGGYGPTALRSEHTYARDFLGRVVSDTVSAAGSGVDLAIRKIRWSYDSHGRLREVGSYDGSEALANLVTFEYDAEGNLVSETQDAGGGWTKTVGYSYAAEEGYPVPRLSGVAYPSGRAVSYARAKGASDWERKDWAVGRLSRISDERAGQAPGYVFYED